jgi:outer membrane protein OmpA-like peptidoglycan-associated protein
MPVNPTRRTMPLVPTALAALMVGACASTTSPELDAARASFEAARGDPELGQLAGGEMVQAEDALGRAETAAADGEGRAVVASQAYVATQSLAAARAAADERRARQRIEELERMREEVRVGALKEQLADLQARQTNRGLVVTLGDVLFSTASAELTPGGRRQIQRIADAIRDDPQRTVLVEGHADSRGSAAYNYDLSQRRADSVRAELILNGVPRAQVVARGLGEDVPVASNATAAGQQQNRRVEIIIQDPRGGAVAAGA